MAGCGTNLMMSIKDVSLNTGRCQIHLNFRTSSKARTASQSSMAKTPRTIKGSEFKGSRSNDRITMHGRHRFGMLIDWLIATHESEGVSLEKATQLCVKKGKERNGLQTTSINECINRIQSQKTWLVVNEETPRALARAKNDRETEEIADRLIKSVEEFNPNTRQRAIGTINHFVNKHKQNRSNESNGNHQADAIEKIKFTALEDKVF